MISGWWLPVCSRVVAYCGFSWICRQPLGCCLFCLLRCLWFCRFDLTRWLFVYGLL